MKIRHREDYRALRKLAYPSVGDQLDAVAKFAQAMRDQGMQLPPDVTAWLDKCKAVKQLYRKDET